MQVDGTLGVTAAITEMLIQSHEGVIDLLPALPDEWSEGKFDGVCARGAFELNFAWKDHKITKAVIYSKQGGLCKLDAKVPIVVLCNGQKTPLKDAGNGVVEFLTQKGEHYNINAK